jgi:hypothetical protein
MNRTAYFLAIALSASGVTGCGTIDVGAQLQNRVTTTLACDRAFVASLYGPIGITSEIDKRDLAEMPCAARDKAALPAPVAK